MCVVGSVRSVFVQHAYKALCIGILAQIYRAVTCAEIKNYRYVHGRRDKVLNAIVAGVNARGTRICRYSVSAERRGSVKHGIELYYELLSVCFARFCCF